MNKLWNIHTIECYSAIKRSEPLIHRAAWMNLKITLLSERSQEQRSTYCLIPFDKIGDKGREKGMEKGLQRGRRKLWGMKHMFAVLIVVIASLLFFFSVYIEV